MPVAHGYIRVSSKDQAESGLGLEAMRETVQQVYEARFRKAGFAFGRIYEDQAVTAGIPLASRKEGRRLAGDLEAGDLVIFPKLDRGFRSVEDTRSTIRVWGERGIRVYFADYDIDCSSPMGRFFLSIMAAAAELERERGGERTREAQNIARKKGKHIGRLPFGLQAVGPKGNRRVEVIPDVYRVSKKILEFRLKDYTWDEIALWCRDHGVTRPVKKNSKLRRHWTVWACRAAYASVLKTLGWIEQGKVHLPKGVQK